MIIHDGFSEITFLGFIVQYVVTFVVAFVVESLIGNRARHIALLIPFDKSNKIKIIIAIATCMVIPMVIIMSAYGLIVTELTGNINGNVYLLYLKYIGLNFIVAYPAQLLIVGPISRWILSNFIQKHNNKKRS